MLDENLFNVVTDNPLVLIADDDVNTQQLLERVLEREGFRVDCVSDGETAIQHALSQHPDLILLDVQMPTMSGFETLEVLRHNPSTKNIPVIMVTAAAREPDDVVHGLDLGADDYLFKPFGVSELIARALSKVRAKRLEEKVAKRNQELEALVKLGTIFNTGLALDDLADRVLTAILDHFGATRVQLCLLENEEVILTRHHGFSTEPQLFFRFGTLPYLARHRDEAILVTDITMETSIETIFEKEYCLSGMATVLKNQGQVCGVITLGSDVSGHFNASDLRVLRSVAEQAALAIRNAQLFMQSQAYAHHLEDMVLVRTRDLQTAQQQLIRAEKMASLGTLAAGIAHEVNNPLQPILTNLEMAVEDMDAGRPIDRELLEFATRDVERIKRIVMRLLDFARPTTAELSPLDVNIVLQEVLILTKKQLEHSKINLSITFEAKSKINGSADQLKQVFLNLVVNARDAMPDGGSLTVNTEEDDHWVMIHIADNGIGIDPEHLNQIFDPFYTTKPSGTGLGLSISYGIMERHGGEIEVESNTRGGTKI